MDVEWQGDGRGIHDKLPQVDLENPDNNNCLGAILLPVVEGRYNLLADVVVFLNGILSPSDNLRKPADEDPTLCTAFNQL